MTKDNFGDQTNPVRDSSYYISEVFHRESDNTYWQFDCSPGGVTQLVWCEDIGKYREMGK